MVCVACGKWQGKKGEGVPRQRSIPRWLERRSETGFSSGGESVQGAEREKVMRERNYYPGYVMIEIADGKLGDDLKDVIKNTSNVIHFLGKENPIALRKSEVNKMLGKMDEMAEAGGISMSEPFIIGETIKIIEGPFNDFNGVIEEVNDEKKKLKVTVKIFGRSTPVELNYMQVEKIS
jgi:transcriptional antiterminator NusG